MMSVIEGQQNIFTSQMFFKGRKDKFPLGNDFQKLMLNAGNKVRLQKLLKEMLITKARSVQDTIIYCKGHMSTNLTTSDETLDYAFNHPEADTMMLSTYGNLRNTMGYNGAVVLDTEDTDVYVQAAFVSHQLKGDLFIKQKHTLVRCDAMLPKEVANVIIPMHIITSSDHTSGFYGHGKKSLAEDHQ